MEVLPNYAPVTRIVVLAHDRDFKEWPQSAQFPPIEKMADGGLMVDRCHYPDRVEAKVWDRADHPNARLLPVDAPRAVRHLYSASGQLAYLRGDYEQANRALFAWEKYIKQQRP